MFSHALGTGFGLVIVLHAMLTAPPNVAAQIHSNDANKATMIRRLLHITKAAELAVSAMEASLPAQRRATPQISNAFWDEFARRVRREMPRFVEMMVRSYDAHFTTAQIEGLLLFYESPLGQHLAKVQPLLAVESMQAGEQWGSQLAAEIARDLAQRGTPQRE